jgi:asparagine synthase (glutamine-hydrolysing)
MSVFSYVADDPAIREEHFLDIAADSAGVRPRKIYLDPEQLAEQLDSLILTQEQPFTTTSMWAQNRVFYQVHDETFKVVIDGQGADELFAGYPVFRAARLSEIIRRGDWASALRFIGSIPDRRGTLVLRAIGDLLPQRIRERARGIVGRPTVPAWLDAQWFERHCAASERPSLGSGAPSELRRQLFDAMSATSLPMLLRYADRNAMAFSLENRVPFLTTTIAEFAASLPDDLLIGPDGTTKRVLRSAMRGVVPDVILERRDKIGFATPEARWFRSTPALRTLLQDVAKRPLPTCFARGLRTELSAVAEGRAEYRPEIWRCWNVLRWADLMELEFPS